MSVRYCYYLTILTLTLLALVSIYLSYPVHVLKASSELKPIQQANATPIFRFPVVPNATISGIFDHIQTPTSSGEDFNLKFYNTIYNPNQQGFFFYCSGIGDGESWVGCKTANSGSEVNCPNKDELWYDNHKGIDFEYQTNWHTGATCNLGLFSDNGPSIYAPAPGYILEVDYNSANGWFIRLYHDVDGNGNYFNDLIRSSYLHFKTIPRAPGIVLAEGDFLGTGGMSGLAWTPHLHFEIQRATSSNFNTKWSVDPFGWGGSSADPWPNPNYKLWQPTLRQAIWRGSSAWTRQVRVTNNVIQWGSATAWSGPSAPSAFGLPGSGDIQSQSTFATSKYVYQGFWRSNVGYSRKVPIINGVIDTSSAPPWPNPGIAVSSLPGSGDIQAQGDVVICDRLRQTFWRGDIGWTRGVTITDGEVQWGSADSWPTTGISLSTLPGTGSIQAQDNYVIGNTLHQKYWRNNVEYTHTVPIVSCTPQQGSATPWVSATPTLPGSGTLTATDIYPYP